MYDILFQPVNTLINLKPTALKALGRLGINNVRDLLFYRSYGYKFISVNPDLSIVPRGTEVVVSVVVGGIDWPSTSRQPMKIYTANETGELALVFFNKIPPFMMAKLREGERITISGKIERNGRFMPQLNHPDFILRKELIRRVMPLYHLTYGLINKQLYSYILEGLNAIELAISARMNFGQLHGEGKQSTNSDNSGGNIYDNEREYMRSLLAALKGLHLVHVDLSRNIGEQFIAARNALAAKELFANQVSLQNLRLRCKKNRGLRIIPAKELQQRVLSKLGFTLTEGQLKAMEEIEEDQDQEAQMMRLLQGDVGSGKTLVALLSMLNAVASGYQACLMVPTDLLSTQHYNFFKKAISDICGDTHSGRNAAVGNTARDDDAPSLASDKPINVALLTGKSKIKERRLIKEGLADGTIDILIGTHALFQDEVEFKQLGYVVIDEQHRFGVQQRLDLINKAEHPDVLVMTATPIPRSLTLTMFGDMAISQILTKPKNRKPIITKTMPIERKARLINSLQKKFDRGERVYWVCPLVDPKDKFLDDSEASEHASEKSAILERGCYSDVMTRYAELASIYPEKGAVLHGKIKSADKDKVMASFKDGQLQYLVATTVIEVGIDVPEATLIVIENAEKFGLAQLHQLRGRVGRGKKESCCVLMYSPKNFTPAAQRRLKTMRESSDGFYIAEQDLLLRGGGEILGTRQSGEPDFYFADLGVHAELLVKVNKLAAAVKTSDFLDFQVRLFDKEQDNVSY